MAGTGKQQALGAKVSDALKGLTEMVPSVSLPKEPIFYGAAALAVGAAGVVLTSVLYLFTGPEALPALHPPAAALHAATINAHAMWRAGLVGIFGDVAFATGALVMMTQRKRTGSAMEPTGWVLIALANMIFVLVDALMANVLAPVALTPGGAGAFIGFRHLYDLLFALGSVTAGAGGVLVLWSEAKTTTAPWPRPVSYVGVGLSAVGLLGGLGHFAGLPMALPMGASILLVSALFAYFGFRIARRS